MVETRESAMSSSGDIGEIEEAGSTSGRLRDRMWRSVESTIDPLHDTAREVLPDDAWSFIVYFAKQAKGPFFLLLVTGGLAGVVDAAMYWGVGWLIDLLDQSSPARLLTDHWPELAALLFVILVLRAVVMIAAAVVEQQVIVPGFYSMVRWQSFR